MKEVNINKFLHLMSYCENLGYDNYVNVILNNDVSDLNFRSFLRRTLDSYKEMGDELKLEIMTWLYRS